MNSPTKEQVGRALASVISDLLRKGQEARVPGLGAFRAHHEASQVERRADGEIIMRPPRDVVVFAADE